MCIRVSFCCLLTLEIISLFSIQVSGETVSSLNWWVAYIPQYIMWLFGCCFPSDVFFFFSLLDSRFCTCAHNFSQPGYRPTFPQPTKPSGPWFSPPWHLLAAVWDQPAIIGKIFQPSYHYSPFYFDPNPSLQQPTTKKPPQSQVPS